MELKKVTKIYYDEQQKKVVVFIYNKKTNKHIKITDFYNSYNIVLKELGEVEDIYIDKLTNNYLLVGENNMLAIPSNYLDKQNKNNSIIQKINNYIKSHNDEIYNINNKEISDKIFLKIDEKIKKYKLNEIVNRIKPLILAGAVTITMIQGGLKLNKLIIESQKKNKEQIESVEEKLDSIKVINKYDVYKAKREEYYAELINELYNLESRLDVIEFVNSDGLSFGSKLDQTHSDILLPFINSEEGKIVFDQALEYGIDPYLLYSIGMQETLLRNISSNGYAAGIFQIEIAEGQERENSGYNFNTNETDTIKYTKDNVGDTKTSATIAAMELQTNYDYYNGNMYLMLQSYNMGRGAVDMILDKIAYDKNITAEEYKENFNVEEFVTELGLFSPEYLSYIDNLPQFIKDRNSTAIDYMINSGYTRYGDPNYISNVYRYYIGEYGMFMDERFDYNDMTFKDFVPYKHKM